MVSPKRRRVMRLDFSFYHRYKNTLFSVKLIYHKIHPTRQVLFRWVYKIIRGVASDQVSTNNNIW